MEKKMITTEQKLELRKIREFGLNFNLETRRRRQIKAMTENELWSFMSAEELIGEKK